MPMPTCGTHPRLPGVHPPAANPHAYFMNVPYYDVPSVYSYRIGMTTRRTQTQWLQSKIKYTILFQQHLVKCKKYYYRLTNVYCQHWSQNTLFYHLLPTAQGGASRAGNISSICCPQDSGSNWQPHSYLCYKMFFLLNLQNSIIGKKNKKCKEALTAHLILKIQPTSGLLFAVFDMWQTQKYLKAASFSVCIELSKETLCAKNSEWFLRYPPQGH